MKRQTAVNCTSWGGVWAKETAAVKNGSRSADLMTASKGYLNGTDYISVLDWDLGTAPCGGCALGLYDLPQNLPCFRPGTLCMLDYMQYLKR